MNNDLVERVARAIAKQFCLDAEDRKMPVVEDAARAAIRVVVEECARVADDYHTARGAADAIRTLANETKGE